MRLISLINHFFKPLQIPFLCGQSNMGRTTMKSMHSIYRQKTLYHELWSERASERTNKRSGAHAKRAVRSKQMSERCKRTRERRSEWPSMRLFHTLSTQCAIRRYKATRNTANIWVSCDVVSIGNTRIIQTSSNPYYTGNIRCGGHGI